MEQLIEMPIRPNIREKDTMDITQRLALVDSWLQLNDPTHAMRLNDYASTLEIAAPAGLPVVSAASLAGPDREAALRKAKLLKESSDPVSVFKDDLGDGCSTILNMARRASGFNPLDTKDPQAAKRFENYLDRVQKAPFFMLMYARKTVVHNKSSDWDKLISAIGDTFEGLADEDKKGVIKSLTSLAKVAASKEETKQSEDLFVQSVIHAGSEYEIFLYNSHVTLESSTEKGSTSRQSSFELVTVKLRLLKSLWPLSAEKVYRAGHAKAVDDWLDENTTEPGGVRANLCIGARL